MKGVSRSEDVVQDAMEGDHTLKRMIGLSK